MVKKEDIWIKDYFKFHSLIQVHESALILREYCKQKMLKSKNERNANQPHESSCTKNNKKPLQTGSAEYKTAATEQLAHFLDQKYTC